jgi:hypothetical protein
VVTIASSSAVGNFGNSPLRTRDNLPVFCTTPGKLVSGAGRPIG